MKTKVEEIWIEAIGKARNQPIGSEGYRFTRLDPDSLFDVYAGIDSSSSVLLAIGVHSKPPNIELRSSAIDYFRLSRQDGSWLMVLRLCEKDLESVFGRLCQDLADASADVATETSLIGLFKERINLWIKLFQRVGSGLLQPYQVKGLIAELLVLESFVQLGCRTCLEVVLGWLGPLSGDQDFLFSDVAVEVKAVAPGANKVSISSLHQFVCVVPLHLFLMVLRQAAPGEFGAVSLNSIVTRIENRVAFLPEALKVFKDRMLEAGYVEHEFYDTLLYEPISRASYDVSETFPKLTPDMVAEGIVSANYSISLDKIEQFKEVETRYDGR